MSGVILPQFMWTYSTNAEVKNSNSLIELTTVDQYFHNRQHQRQFIAFRLKDVLNPSVLCSSMHVAANIYPKVTSRIVSHFGKQYFHVGQVPPKVELIMVEPKFFSDIYAWKDACFQISEMTKHAHNNFVQAYLFRSHDPRFGCVLATGFDHSIGDAASYCMFLSAWSKAYSAELLRASHLMAPPQLLPSGIFNAGMDSSDLRWIHGKGRRYWFSAALLAEMKTQLRMESGIDLSSNDVLMTQARPTPSHFFL